MLQIKKMRSDHVIDFAAEELKKYLRMMMPHGGDIQICYESGATDGFRLGLLEDFGLPFEGEDPVLDDVIHVDTDENGGILAGSNLRSVLFAVYRMLRENGCRWLYPGVDGDYVPLKDIGAVKYHKMADHRFRGHCNEGSESQQAMLDTIDYYAKLELNVYMLEFFVPFYYYDNYYSHKGNQRYRTPEPVSQDQIVQWKRQCEVEIAKRGLQFHDIGHGWCCEPFGFKGTDGFKSTEGLVITDEQRQYLAMVDGKRKFHLDWTTYTNVCMSNPKVRKIMVDAIVEHAEKNTNVDYLHVWLADGRMNHCECDECQKMRPSDWYMMIMNELDEALTDKGLDTRIVFIAYVDTLFAAQTVKVKNPKRFSLLYAPIFRSYSSSITEDAVIPEPAPYVRNNWQMPKAPEEALAFLKAWQKVFPGPCFSYEYHYWRYQFYDPGLMTVSRRIYEDIRSLKYCGLDGYVEDGSQRSFFPNGFHMYIYAETLMNRDCDYDAVLEDYFSHIYGDSWKAVRSYLTRVSEAFDFRFLTGDGSEDSAKGDYYSLTAAKQMEKVKGIAAQGRAIAKDHRVMPDRPKTISMRLLELHAEYIEGVAAFMIEKAKGNDHLAYEMFTEFFLEYGRHEFEIERYYDHGLAWLSYSLIVRKPPENYMGM